MSENPGYLSCAPVFSPICHWNRQKLPLMLKNRREYKPVMRYDARLWLFFYLQFTNTPPFYSFPEYEMKASNKRCYGFSVSLNMFMIVNTQSCDTAKNDSLSRGYCFRYCMDDIAIRGPCWSVYIHTIYA